MTVYVTGDIHGGLDMQKLRDWELGDSLTSDDYLIVAGDFGFPWDFSAEECADIAWLESRPYTVLFVDGNHERFDHWEERPMEPWHGGLTQRLSDTSPMPAPDARRGLRARRLDGLHHGRCHERGQGISRAVFQLVASGASGRARFRCRAGEARRGRLKVDCVITHTCSTRMLSPTLYPDPSWERPDVDRLTEFLDELEDRLDYKRWYYGHFHRDGNPDERHTVLYDRIVRLGDKLLPWGAY